MLRQHYQAFENEKHQQIKSFLSADYSITFFSRLVSLCVSVDVFFLIVTSICFSTSICDIKQTAKETHGFTDLEGVSYLSVHERAQADGQ